MKAAQVQEVVFAGVSLGVVEVPERPGRIVLGPARRGDVKEWLARGCRRFLLLDGVMVYGHPPSPSEIARALEAGATVLGAASLGALRAVELRRHPGMSGMGWVYEAVLQGRVLGDDELLARLHPETGRPENLFLVNIMYGLERLCASNAVPRAAADDLLAHLRVLHFEARRSSVLRELCEQLHLPDTVATSLLDDENNVKRGDALAALRAW